MVLIARLKAVWNNPAWTPVKWAAMSAAVFWTLVYQLAASAAAFPEFVYVNF